MLKAGSMCRRSVEVFSCDIGPSQRALDIGKQVGNYAASMRAKLKGATGPLLVACSGAFPSAEPDSQVPLDGTDFRAQNLARINRIFRVERLCAARRFGPLHLRSIFVLKIDIER